jgi:acyl carrier protein
MNEEKISELVRIELREVLRVKIETITPEARLFGDLGAESIDVLDLRFRLEWTFGINISDSEIVDSLGNDLSIDELDRQFTVRSIVWFIEQKLRETVGAL